MGSLAMTPFNEGVSEGAKAMLRKKLGDRLAWVDRQLEGRACLMGDAFSVADAYLFTVATTGDATRCWPST
jgi:glutathione S-transferase